MIKLIKENLKSPIFDDGKLLDPQEGTRHGGVLSPLLCNIYINQLELQIIKFEKEYLEKQPLSNTLKPNKDYYYFGRGFKRERSERIQ